MNVFIGQEGHVFEKNACIWPVIRSIPSDISPFLLPALASLVKLELVVITGMSIYLKLMPNNVHDLKERIPIRGCLFYPLEYPSCFHVLKAFIFL